MQNLIPPVGFAPIRSNFLKVSIHSTMSVDMVSTVLCPGMSWNFGSVLKCPGMSWIFLFFLEIVLNCPEILLFTYFSNFSEENIWFNLLASETISRPIIVVFQNTCSYLGFPLLEIVLEKQNFCPEMSWKCPEILI